MQVLYSTIVLPSGKLTWQWNIPIFNRKSIFKASIFQPAVLDYRSVTCFDHMFGKHIRINMNLSGWTHHIQGDDVDSTRQGWTYVHFQGFCSRNYQQQLITFYSRDMFHWRNFTHFLHGIWLFQVVRPSNITETKHFFWMIRLCLNMEVAC